MLKRHPLVQLRLRPELWENEFEFVTLVKDKGSACLGAHANPINFRRRTNGPVRFDGNLKSSGVQRVDDGLVDLEEWFTSCKNNEAVLRELRRPSRDNCGCQFVGRGESSSPVSVNSDEICVAELALRHRPVCLAP